MTPNESPALRTNDEPQRILLEASERIKACYPNGIKIEALIDGKLKIGIIDYRGLGTWELLNSDGVHLFSPAVHPHRVLP